jgi:hypothetical protein
LFDRRRPPRHPRQQDDDRLRYWYDDDRIRSLARLKAAIESLPEPICRRICGDGRQTRRSGSGGGLFTQAGPGRSFPGNMLRRRNRGFQMR